MRRTLETEELVGISEIAERSEVSKQAVTNWVARYSDFPRPIVILASGPVFYWRDVVAWLTRTGRM